MWPYDQQDKDLHRLVVERITDAIERVTQLAETPEQHAMIIMAALCRCAGMAGALIAVEIDRLDRLEASKS